MDSLGYIDNYFKGECSPEEARLFDRRVQEDPAFAEEVAFYVSALAAGREQVAEERKVQFRELLRLQKQTNTNLTVVRKPLVRRMVTSLAAAASVAAVVFGLIIVFRPTSPSQIAESYIKENLKTLPVKMGPMDSFQKSIDLYNDGKYSEALQAFEGNLRSNPSDSKILEEAGITCLRMQDYDKALDYFRRLESHPQHANPAVFYEALTLLRRNLAGDTEKAQQLLQEVQDKDLDMKEAARDLLKKLK
jgi:tetratricopeptide (TPR) repeat protein